MVTPALAPKRSAGASVRTGGQTYYLFPDHPSASSGQALGRTHITANSSGTELGKLLYRPWGETRFSTGTTPTTWRFTGQREDATIGLYFYNARYYDPYLNRWIQPDTIVPDPGDRQSHPRMGPRIHEWSRRRRCMRRRFVDGSPDTIVPEPGDRQSHPRMGPRISEWSRRRRCMRRRFMDGGPTPSCRSRAIGRAIHE